MIGETSIPRVGVLSVKVTKRPKAPRTEPSPAPRGAAESTKLKSGMRRYLLGTPTRLTGSLSRERNGPRSGKSLRESSEHHEVSVERDPLKPTNAKWGKPVLVLEPTELALDSGAATVERAPPLRLARDQRVQA